MAVSSGCLRKLVFGWGIFGGAQEERASFMVIGVGLAKKEAGPVGSPASIKVVVKLE